MIDWITAELPCLHSPLNSGRVFKLDSNGSIEWASACFISIAGSFESKISIKSSGGDGQGNATHILFSGNPSKFLQGHNVFGSDNLLSLVFDTYVQILKSLDLTPNIRDLHDVKVGSYTLSRVDVNYSYELPSRADVLAWIRAAEYTSKTRHGRPSSKGGTLYWGKTSKRWALKAYSKGEEIEVIKHKLPDKLLGTPLSKWADNKLRIELVLRSTELDDIKLKYAAAWAHMSVKKLFMIYLERLDMSQKVALSDQQLDALPQRLKSTYILWRSGHDLRSTLPKTTYYRHRKEFIEQGINIGAVQPLTKNNVVPLVRILEAQPADIPIWAYEMRLIHHSAQMIS